MSCQLHREKLKEALPDKSLVISYAGIPVHSNEDDAYELSVNSQYYYLTGMEQENTALMILKCGSVQTETMFIEEADPLAERWTGKMPTKEEVTERTGVKDVRYIDSMDRALLRILSRFDIEYVFFDLSPGSEEQPDYNFAKACAFQNRYPSVRMQDLRKILIPIREVKDTEEIDAMRKAVEITKNGLEYVLTKLKPGMMEYQVQADFEYSCKVQGAKKQAFPTIAGSGLNGCMMHYMTNHCEVKDGSLILLDLGAKYENYCSDITRTYPANGKYSPRQREIYGIVLKANEAVRAAARPGVTLKELNEIAKEVLAEGLIGLGLIKDAEEVGKYYMHGVSHPIGIDCHDVCFDGDQLRPGFVISDEPGLYIDEEEIGIRIEDDLLITEDGCEVLSAGIMKDPDEIEAFMAKNRG